MTPAQLYSDSPKVNHVFVVRSVKRFFYPLTAQFKRVEQLYRHGHVQLPTGECSRPELSPSASDKL